VGDVHGIASGVAAKVLDGIGRHLSYHQTSEAAGAKSFV
jgi:hypothetical protein